MSIKYTFSVCWKFLFLGNFASCVVMEAPNGIPYNAEGLPKEYGNIPVPYPRASEPDGPVGWEGATPTVMSVITPPPATMFAPCQPINCTANASVRKSSPYHYHNFEASLDKPSPCPSSIGPQRHKTRPALLH